MMLYHGGTDIVKKPEIILSEQGRDFGFGFYATNIYEQALKWAKRQGRIRKKQAILNIYEFDSDKAERSLNFKAFVEYSIEWLEIANDDVGETVQAVVDGFMPLDFVLQKLAFMPANNQYAFCSENSLAYINFSKFQELE